MSDAIDDLAALWRWFGNSQFRDESPIYESIALAVAGDRDVLAVLREAPPAAHLPLTPLAAMRYLLLSGADHPLQDVFTGEADADPGLLFLDVCHELRSPLLEVLETRRVQTNDCGRSALIGPALAWLTQRHRGPYWLIDVGASAGLNLLFDHYRIDYGSHGATGPPDSPVHICCDVFGGHPPIADRFPDVIGRVGIDLSPVNLFDPSDARWLLACVWPDSGRVTRVEASIRLALQHAPTLVAGRANDVLPSLLSELPAEVTAVVITTWAFGYFSTDERIAFVDLLRAASEHHRLAWISAENPGVVRQLDKHDPRTRGDVLGVMLFGHGAATAHLLARVQPHARWLEWLASPTVP